MGGDIGEIGGAEEEGTQASKPNLTLILPASPPIIPSIILASPLHLIRSPVHLLHISFHLPSTSLHLPRRPSTCPADAQHAFISPIFP